MKILISGLCGRMGREVAALCEAGVRGATLVCGVDSAAVGAECVPCAASFETADPMDADCIIDFSHHSLTHDLLTFAKKHRLPLVLATTGHTQAETEEIKAAAAEIPLFWAANFSLGVALLIELAQKAVRTMPEAEIEIVEKHHSGKVDAPSGTALAIAEAIREVRPQATLLCGRSGQGKRPHDEIGIHAVRMGGIVGEHEVLLSTPSQTITLKHEAHSRALFAEGALAAAAYLIGRTAGLYNMKDLLRA